MASKNLHNIKRLEHLFQENRSFDLIDNKYIFDYNNSITISDSFDIVKNKLKKYYKLYAFAIKFISPVFSSNNHNTVIKKYLESDTVCINIGSGNSMIHPQIYNIDIEPYQNVDLVCDITNLPFKDNTIDMIFNIAVLEHIQNPDKVIAEIYRVLKPGGIVYTAFPFIQGFHASPYDFTRVTEKGILTLHDKFNMIEIKPFGGPTSGMLWIFQEWIAILLSFGSKKLFWVTYFLAMLTTFPIKYMDFFLLKHPMAKNISSGFSYVGRKPRDQ